jgi:hypothetical protein
MLRRRYYGFTAIFSGFFAFVFLLLTASPAFGLNATDLNVITDCNSPTKTSYTGLLQVPVGGYTIYTQLAKRGQTAQITTYAEDGSLQGGCATIGTVIANGDVWTKVGHWVAVSTESQTIFQLSSDQLGLSIDANRPSVMLVSDTNPVCVPTTRCNVTLDSQSGYILPPGTLTTQDSLHVVRIINPSEDTVVNVTYYVDSEPAYTTKTLQDFDLRYVTLSNQKLSRVVGYASGQRLVLDSQPPDTFSDTFANFLFKLVRLNPRLLMAIGLIVGISLLLYYSYHTKASCLAT